mmetsp:Transcript_16276/g.51018  ORF Transcript_16276/g.51018 Transcript_16276/m.51018 type:complete len:465 (-) Transcript_16276:374-1768(-)
MLRDAWAPDRLDLWPWCEQLQSHDHHEVEHKRHVDEGYERPKRVARQHEDGERGKRRREAVEHWPLPDADVEPQEERRRHLHEHAQLEEDNGTHLPDLQEEAQAEGGRAREERADKAGADHLLRGSARPDKALVDVDGHEAGCAQQRGVCGGHDGGQRRRSQQRHEDVLQGPLLHQHIRYRGHGRGLNRGLRPSGCESCFCQADCNARRLAQERREQHSKRDHAEGPVAGGDVDALHLLRPERERERVQEEEGHVAGGLASWEGVELWAHGRNATGRHAAIPADVLHCTCHGSVFPAGRVGHDVRERWAIGRGKGGHEPEVRPQGEGHEDEGGDHHDALDRVREDDALHAPQHLQPQDGTAEGQHEDPFGGSVLRQAAQEGGKRDHLHAQEDQHRHATGRRTQQPAAAGAVPVGDEVIGALVAALHRQAAQPRKHEQHPGHADHRHTHPPEAHKAALVCLLWDA